MPLSGFFRIAWTIQLGVGIALFCVSLWIENQVLHAFFAAPVMALALAIALELGKAAAIVWHRYLSLCAATAYPRATLFFSAAFRIGLVLLSVLCSLFYLGVRLDRPNLESIRTAELAAIDKRQQADLARLDADRQAREQQDLGRRRGELDDARQVHQRQIDELEALLRAEMDRVVGGVFKGPRYQELERRLSDARGAREAALTALSERQRREAAQSAATLARELAGARRALVADADARRRAVRESNFDRDDRTHAPMVVTLIRMSADCCGHRVTAPQLVFAFALFLSVLTELGILLAFDTVTLAVNPALAVQHREAVMEESLRAQVEGAATREEIRHREAMDRVRKGADRVLERAQAHSQAHSQAQGHAAAQVHPTGQPRKAA